MQAWEIPVWEPHPWSSGSMDPIGKEPKAMAMINFQCLYLLCKLPKVKIGPYIHFNECHHTATTQASQNVT